MFYEVFRKEAIGAGDGLATWRRFSFIGETISHVMDYTGETHRYISTKNTSAFKPYDVVITGYPNSSTFVTGNTELSGHNTLHLVTNVDEGIIEVTPIYSMDWTNLIGDISKPLSNDITTAITEFLKALFTPLPPFLEAIPTVNVTVAHDISRVTLLATENISIKGLVSMASKGNEYGLTIKEAISQVNRTYTLEIREDKNTTTPVYDAVALMGSTEMVSPTSDVNVVGLYAKSDRSEFNKVLIYDQNALKVVDWNGSNPVNADGVPLGSMPIVSWQQVETPADMTEAQLRTHSDLVNADITRTGVGTTVAVPVPNLENDSLHLFNPNTKIWVPNGLQGLRVAYMDYITKVATITNNKQTKTLTIKGLSS